MKFAKVLAEDNRPTPALIDDKSRRYWPLNELQAQFSGSLDELIANWEDVAAGLGAQGAGKSLEGVKVLAPLAPKRNIFCVGKNYHEHAAEFSKSGFDHSAKDGEIAPEFPVIFTKTPDSVIGHLDPIPPHAGVTQQLDYEAELGVIIGKGGRGISKENAYAHVWGYTIINDVTARDLQKNHRQWFLGKSLDGFCPMGPWIVTADEFNPENATIKCWVNEELRQQANVNALIFDIPALIECLSAGIELKPGDVISTGTPVGVGIGFTPPRFLHPGDNVRIEIEGIGTLENRIDQD
ncbi:fumarylacetoacetate hydrolase family protein [Pseudomonas sp. NPDC088368]|jgi:2-keto-4-pentenoate hydratase/2-oxohepta-3-ene-1,7-dioic acid hydratase in catechol pathway|uniref:fumarylacetoacetate hydrolase family protein n=1 Tax=Pseudomonas sp. NPDC088368 TaxID=3364453 RepID=UPI00381744FF